MRSAAASDAVDVNVSSVEKLSGNATVTYSELVRRHENDKAAAKNNNNTDVRRKVNTSVGLFEGSDEVANLAGEFIQSISFKRQRLAYSIFQRSNAAERFIDPRFRNGAFE